ncbi:hypothetical protein QVD17_06868 [Tagetes erecta]|uniref:BZIP domain-containing protein n=1 Tax=Tagetes erecta TaxID=13708 RepID=A0AAD8PCH0_TARER|nr:hypothetical protein QVD17_06868 [Tagetes erecta]
MKPMDDVWKHINNLPSLHHTITTTHHHHFQDFLAPATTPSGRAIIHLPSPPPRPLAPPLTTMLSLSTSGNSEDDQDQDLDHDPPHIKSTTRSISSHVVKVRQTSTPEYTEKFKRLMKNRESASRSRARKQARADELEHEVSRLTKENAKLKRLHKEFLQLCSASTTHVPKKPRLLRSKSAPL